MLTNEIKESINESVLCWLATSDQEGFPNCSPKEAFAYYGEDQLVIANIASPESVKNIEANPNVCVSVVEVFKQKGFKLKGAAEYLTPDDQSYGTYAKILSPIVGDAFPILGIIIVNLTSSAPIIAPGYYLIPGTTVESQIQQAKKTYGV